MTPEIVLGPPGTGKTTTLLNLVDEELAEGTYPDRIGYVSFTKRAAAEAIERAMGKFNFRRQELRYFRTLHSMCFQVLGLSSGDVFERKRTVEFGNWIGVQLSEHITMDEGTTFGNLPGDRAMFMENLARVKIIPLREQYEINSDDLGWNFVERIADGMRKYKKTQHLLDYTDMLDRFVQQQYSPDIDVLFVDEAQDLSMLQWQVVWKLASTCRRVVIAGDDDQAIYRWAGAALEYFIALRGKVRVLGQSWRVPHAVQQVSQGVIQRVHSRRPKDWAPKDSEGVVSYLQSFEEIDVWTPDVLILVRNAYVARNNVLPLLRQDGVIYEWKGHISVRPTVIEAVRAWETLRQGKSVTVDEVRRVYEYMSSGQGVRRGYKTLPNMSGDDMVTLSELREHGGLMRDEIWHEALDRIPKEERLYLVRARQKGERTTGKPRVRVSTIHGSKGGEADHVVVLTDMAKRTWQEMYKDPENEARVWYVAVTRAREQLSIIAPSGRSYYDI